MMLQQSLPTERKDTGSIPVCSHCDLVFPQVDTDSVLSPLQGCYDTESGHIFKNISPKVMVVIEYGN